MTDSNSAAFGGEMLYAYKPSVFGAAWQFALKTDGIEWSIGRQSGRVLFRNIRRVRMSFRPVTMQSHRFLTEVWSDNGPRLAIVSASWKSMVEQERLDPSYTAFVTELHRRIAAAGASVRFETGTNVAVYWLGVLLFLAVALGLAGLIARAIRVEAWAGAAFIGGFLALFLWQAGNYFRRNRPTTYRADALPTNLLPRT